MSPTFFAHGVLQVKPRPFLTLLFMVCSFAISFAIAWGLCGIKIERMRETIVSNERFAQRERVERMLSAVNSWRNEIERQANIIAFSDDIRIYAKDSENLRFADGNDRSGDLGAEERMLLKQGEYLAIRLNQICASGMFAGISVFYPDGEVMLPGPKISQMEQHGFMREMLLKAGKEGQTVFSPFYEENNWLFAALAVPLVSGDSSERPLGSVVFVIDMQSPLASFLEKGQGGEITPAIAINDNGKPSIVFMRNMAFSANPVGEKALSGLPFAKRNSLTEKGGEAWSLGNRAEGLDWTIIAETPAHFLLAKTKTEETTILLAGAGIAAFAAFCATALWVWWYSSSNLAHSRKISGLYETINAQNAILHGINSSLKAGVALVNSRGEVEVFNQAFSSIADNVERGSNIAEIFRGGQALDLYGAASATAESGKDHALEMVFETREGARLFRISLFPYSGCENSAVDSGCVMVFSDITEFRKMANLARERRMAVTAALVRAIESVDPLLCGHSWKNLALAERFALALDMDPEKTETLKLSAVLSQVGKFFVPRHIFSKNGTLSDEEQAEIRKIPMYSEKFMSQMNLDLPVGETVSQMWRITAAGKPVDKISALAMILAIINSYTAMTSDRAWRKGMDSAEAVSRIEKDPRFDSRFTAVLAKIIQTC